MQTTPAANVIFGESNHWRIAGRFAISVAPDKESAGPPGTDPA